MAFPLAANAANIYDVGAFDAKTYFSELLRKVQDGAVVNISKNGKQVAVLQGLNKIQNKAAYAAHKRILARAKKMTEIRTKEGFTAMTVKEIKELKDAGRKY